MAAKTPTYKIRQVIELTGASEFLLRIWEHRYGALKPVRTKTGRRLYTNSDILKVRALLALTQQGHRVGDIANKNLNELNKLQMPNHAKDPSLNGQPQIEDIMANVAAFEWPKVRSLVLNSERNEKPINWVHSTVVPLISEVGQHVASGKISIAQEHILSAIIKECVALRFNKKPTPVTGPRLVLATPEGDFHDLGLFIASQIGSALKINTLYLGAHMPKAELAAVCVRYEATHLLLSSTTETHEGARDDFLNYLNFLDRNLNPNVTLWLAGRNAEKYPVRLKRPFQFIDSFATFEREVKKCLK